MNKFLIFIKSFLIKLLGKNKYLKLISRVYFFLRKQNLLKYFGQELHDVFHLHKFIKEGDVCIDIGANLGYYSVPFSNLCGRSGKVYAVEPVKIFVETLEVNLKSFALDNVVIYNYALGENDGEILKMGTPIVDGIFRHGYTKVVEDDGFEYADTYDVEVKNPSLLFNNLESLSFLKCDVEGYENHIIPLMYDLIKLHKPVVLLEFGSPENRRVITKELIDIGYEVFSVSKTEMIKVENPGESASETFNFFFIPKN